MNNESWRLLKYKDKNGNDPVGDFLDESNNNVSVAERGQIVARMKTVIEQGMLAVNGDIVKNLGENLYVLRVPNTKNNPRIFMCNLSNFRPKCFVMLHAYPKRTKKIPEAEMRIARQRLKEVQDNPNEHVF